MMKYYLYSYTWRAPGSSCRHSAQDMGIFESMVDLYEFVAKQEEDWCLTHVAEINDLEYDKAASNGLIG